MLLCTRRYVPTSQPLHSLSSFRTNHRTLSIQTAAVLALTEVRSEDKSELSKLVSTIKEGYSDKYEEAKRHWGGGIMGQKAIARTEKKRKALEAAIKI